MRIRLPREVGGRELAEIVTGAANSFIDTTDDDPRDSWVVEERPEKEIAPSDNGDVTERVYGVRVRINYHRNGFLTAPFSLRTDIEYDKVYEVICFDVDTSNGNGHYDCHIRRLAGLIYQNLDGNLNAFISDCLSGEKSKSGEDDR